MATPNPYRRLRELTGKSQKDFAEKYELSRTTMTYIESGQVPDLSERMILALGQECHESGVDAAKVFDEEYQGQNLADAYNTWKSNERVQNAHLFQVPLLGAPTSKTSPFSTFIEDTTGSRQRFCKLLKVPSAAVQLYADGKTQTMPRVIEEALLQVQFRELGALRDLQEQWNTLSE